MGIRPEIVPLPETEPIIPPGEREQFPIDEPVFPEDLAEQFISGKWPTLAGTPKTPNPPEPTPDQQELVKGLFADSAGFVLREDMQTFYNWTLERLEYLVGAVQQQQSRIQLLEVQLREYERVHAARHAEAMPPANLADEYAALRKSLLAGLHVPPELLSGTSKFSPTLQTTSQVWAEGVRRQHSPPGSE